MVNGGQDSYTFDPGKDAVISFSRLITYRGGRSRSNWSSDVMKIVAHGQDGQGIIGFALAIPMLLLRILARRIQKRPELKTLTRNREIGQALVEFLLVLPFLIVLIMGTIEFGRLLAIYSLTNAASREAARYGAGAGDHGPGSKIQYQDCDGIASAAMRVSGALININSIEINYDNGPGTSLIVPVGCPPPADQVGLGTRIVVRLTYDYEPVFPFVPIPAKTITSETARTLLIDIDVGQ